MKGFLLYHSIVFLPTFGRRIVGRLPKVDIRNCSRFIYLSTRLVKFPFKTIPFGHCQNQSFQSNFEFGLYSLFVLQSCTLLVDDFKRTFLLLKSHDNYLALHLVYKINTTASVCSSTVASVCSHK